MIYETGLNDSFTRLTEPRTNALLGPKINTFLSSSRSTILEIYICLELYGV